MERDSGIALMNPRPVMWVADQVAEENLQEQLQTGGLEALEVKAALELCPALNPDWLIGAALDLDSGDIDVPALMQNYISLLGRQGGEVIFEQPVTHLGRRRNTWTVQTPSVTFETPLVVNAAGAWIDEIAELAGVRPVGAMPLRRTICISQVEWQGSLSSWPMVIDTGSADHVVGRFYFKPYGDHEVLLSPCEEVLVAPADVQPEPAQERQALFAVNAATRLRLRAVTRSWAGLRTFVPDRLPVVGFQAADPGFFWFGAQGGFGIQVMPALARAASALVRGHSLPPDLTALGINLDLIAPDRGVAATDAPGGS
jgi:D-arginine dehydrogenase